MDIPVTSWIPLCVLSASEWLVTAASRRSLWRKSKKSSSVPGGKASDIMAARIPNILMNGQAYASVKLHSPGNIRGYPHCAGPCAGNR